MSVKRSSGQIALTGSADNTARLWDTATGKGLGPPLQHQGSVLGVALSADGKITLTSSDKTARLWNVPQPLAGDPFCKGVRREVRRETASQVCLGCWQTDAISDPRG